MGEESTAALDTQHVGENEAGLAGVTQKAEPRLNGLLFYWRVQSQRAGVKDRGMTC